MYAAEIGRRNGQGAIWPRPGGHQNGFADKPIRKRTARLQLYRRAGYHKVREWLHLLIEMDAPPAVPALPEGFWLRAMDLDEDWELVGPAMDEAFADHWGALTLPEPEPDVEENEGEGDEILEDESYSNSPGHCFITMDRDKAAGAVLCNARLVERDDTGRVGSLFVRPQYRKQGIGRALMLAAFQSFWQKGIRRIITDTDAVSFSDSPRFYANLGMRRYRLEILLEKELRPGREARRLEESGLPESA